MPAWPPTTIRTTPDEQPAPMAPEGVVDVTPETLGDRSQVASIRDYLDRRAHLQARDRAGHDGPEAA